MLSTAARAMCATVLPRVRPTIAPRAFASYERTIRNHVRRYRAMVSRFYRPGFFDVFLRPEDEERWGVREAVTSLLAGLFDPKPAVRLKIRAFYALVDLQRRVRLLPRISLPSVFEGSPPAARGDVL